MATTNEAETALVVQGRGYRLFVSPKSVAGLQEAVTKGACWMNGLGQEWSLTIRIDLVPVLEEVVQAQPEIAARFLEIQLVPAGEVKTNGK